MSFGTVSNRNELIGCYIDSMELFKIKIWEKNPIGKATPSSNKKMGIKRGSLST